MNLQNSAPGLPRALAWALYATAALLVLVPLNEFAAQLGWRAMPGALQWRTGAVGLLSGAILTPTLGLVVATVTAFLYDHRWVQRALGVLTGLAALTLLALTVAFTLDALQLRGIVTAPMQRTYLVSVVKALVSFAVVGATLAITCFAIFRAARELARTRPSKRPDNTPETPVVMGLSR